MEMMEAQLSLQSNSLFLVFRTWLRDSMQRRGLWGTMKSFGEQIGYFIRDSFPDRRKSRFGDIDYDCDFGVDTTWARLPLSVRLRELFSERLYQPTDPVEFREVISHVPADLSEFVFIDLGSGKGRALLLASEYPFTEIIGVEVQPELHATAEQNVLRFHASERAKQPITTLCMDAREFRFPLRATLLYLFNPFPDYVLETVLTNLQESLRLRSRPVFVIYNTPWEQHVFRDLGFLQKIYETHNFQIYSCSPISEVGSS